MIIERFNNIFDSIEKRKSVLFNSKIDDHYIFDNIYIENNNSKVTIIYGDNVSGKSLFAWLFEIYCVGKSSEKYDRIPVRAAAMRNRTMSGIQRAIIFGDESDQSTGCTSLNVVIKCIQSTLTGETGVAILDEPDIGLSERYSGALGHYIANCANDFKEHGLVLISHSKTLIKSFLQHYNQPVSYLGVDTSLNYNDWCNTQSVATIEELLQLKEIGFKKQRAIFQAIENNK